MKTRQLLLCAMFAALTAIGAFIKIPIPGTPMLFTLQTFFVFLSGLMLAPRYALIAQLVYAAVGLLGLPIFSTGGGISYVLMPSFGFVIGFAICAFLVSLLVRKNLLLLISQQQKLQRAMRIIKVAGYALLSIVTMYIFGIAYMYMIYNVYLGESVALEFIIVNTTGVFFFLDIAKFAVAIPLGAAVLRRMPKSLVG